MIKWLPLIIILTFAAIVCITYIGYIDIAKTTVPIMDYWRHIAQFGQTILDGELRITDFFGQSFAGHASPLSTYLTFTQLGRNGFDMVPLVEGGMLLRLLLVCVLLAVFQKKYYTRYRGRPVQLIILSAALVMAILNYNQWEMVTQQFSQGATLRVVLYVLFFLAGDGLISVIENKSRGWHFVYAAIYGLLVALMGLLMSSGYIVGFLGAIGFTCICIFLRRYKSWKQYLYPFGVLAVLVIAGMLGYMYLFLGGASSGAGMLSTQTGVLSVLHGIVLYYGGIFVSNTYVTAHGTMLASLVGVFVIGITAVEVAVFLRHDRKGKQVFPLMCVFYAFIIGVTVTLSRIGTFGITTTMSSRYVLESTLGIVGLIWIAAENGAEDQRILATGKQLMITCAVLFMLFSNLKTEREIAPYRGVYSQNLEKLMLTIDKCTDEQLAVMQSTPAYVRQAVKFLRENRLSIFGDPEKWSGEKLPGAEVLRGQYSDQWVGSVVELDVYTEKPSVLVLSGYVPGSLEDPKSMEIHVNGEPLMTYVVAKNAFEVEIPLEGTGEYLVSIHNQFAIQATLPDTRTDLAFVLSSCRLSEGKLPGAEVLRGQYSDRWVGSVLELNVYTAKPSVLVLNGYLPGSLETPKSMEIYVNGTALMTYVVDKNAFEVEILLEGTGEYLVSIHNQFAIQATLPDTRTDLAFVLSDYELNEKQDVAPGVKEAA